MSSVTIIKFPHQLVNVKLLYLIDPNKSNYDSGVVVGAGVGKVNGVGEEAGRGGSVGEGNEVLVGSWWGVAVSLIGIWVLVAGEGGTPCR